MQSYYLLSVDMNKSLSSKQYVNEIKDESIYSSDLDSEVKFKILLLYMLQLKVTISE